MVTCSRSLSSHSQQGGCWASRRVGEEVGSWGAPLVPTCTCVPVAGRGGVRQQHQFWALLWASAVWKHCNSYSAPWAAGPGLSSQQEASGISWAQGKVPGVGCEGGQPPCLLSGAFGAVGPETVCGWRPSAPGHHRDSGRRVPLRGPPALPGPVDPSRTGPRATWVGAGKWFFRSFYFSFLSPLWYFLKPESASSSRVPGPSLPLGTDSPRPPIQENGTSREPVPLCRSILS